MSQLSPTRIFNENRTGSQKIFLNRGSVRASKTYSIVQLAVIWLSQAVGGAEQVWSITRRTLPALKATGYRDFKEIVASLNLWPLIHTNFTDFQFTFNNRMIEFFSLDDQSKVRSRKRDHLHIIEADEISYELFIQLSIRTKGRIYLDFNPSDPFSWLREEIEIKRSVVKGDVKVVVSTYKDNPYLSDVEVNEIEYLKEVDPELWKIFGTGEYGNLTDLIYKKYEETEYPDNCDYQYLGIDFGFSHDPAAVVLVGKSGSNLYLKELVYETGLLNDQLADKIKSAGYGHLSGVADSAEPKSIHALSAGGLNIAAAIKGPDSVRAGILAVREYTLHVDPGSINILKEIRSYKWSDKKAGVPVDHWNHAMDATRYAVTKFMRAGDRVKIGTFVSGTTPFQA